MIFSDDIGKVTKIIQPGELMSMLYTEAQPDVDEFAIGHQVTCIDARRH